MKNLRDGGYTIVHNRPKSGVSEEFRALRTNLMYGNKGLRALLFTSAGLADGKSTIACNTAISFAQAGNKVLLIDGNMRDPRIAAALGLNSAGLYELLEEDGRHESELIQQSVLNDDLYVLTAGSTRDEPPELLCSSRMATLMASLREAYEYIIIDSPPICAYTDAAILSTLVDGVLLVIKSGVTGQTAAKDALEALSRVGAHVAGVILNFA